MESQRKILVISLLKALGITALAFVLSLLMVSPLSFSATSIFSPPERQDYTISDFYAQVADRRPVRTLEDRVVIVDVGSMNRAEIAETLSTLALCGPRSVGIDIMFEQPAIMGEDVDSLLIGSINELRGASKVVSPLDVKEIKQGEYALKTAPFFYKKIPGLTYGAANLPSKQEKGTIREFAVDYPPYETFSVAVASTVDAGAVAKLKERGSRLEIIDYPSREYTVIPAQEIVERADELLDKVVMVGSMDDKNDLHAVPLTSSSSGVFIQAASLVTILSGSYYSAPGKIWDWFMASFLCFVVTLLGLLVNVKVKGLVVRILQLIYNFH